jgi:hypothetical protein
MLTIGNISDLERVIAEGIQASNSQPPTPNGSHKIEFSLLNGNLMVPADRLSILFISL